MQNRSRLSSERAGAETKNWDVSGAKLGLTIGAGFAIFELILFNTGILNYGFIEEVVTVQILGQLIAPLILIVFGGLAGALVGGGTPRFNPNPQQGGPGRAYHFFRHGRSERHRKHSRLTQEPDPLI